MTFIPGQKYRWTGGNGHRWMDGDEYEATEEYTIRDKRGDTYTFSSNSYALSKFELSEKGRKKILEGYVVWFCMKCQQECHLVFKAAPDDCVCTRDCPIFDHPAQWELKDK